MSLARTRRRISAALTAAADKSAGAAVSGLLRFLRKLDRIRVSNFSAAFMRMIGPRLREHRIGRTNLVAAFPEKSPEEIEKILIGVWDNLGRVAGEYAHLDRIVVGDPENRVFIDYFPGTAQRFKNLRDDGKPALIFAAHLANWELPACLAAADGLDTIVLYRRPNLGSVADAVTSIREGHMGEMLATSMSAPLRIANALEAGRHAAMLVDQHYVKGVDVTFFGRPCKANPLIAMLAREAECTVHGTRVVRLPNGRFRAELTEPVELPRDGQGKIDVQGAMQAITSVIEGWVREHPDQWLWLHRRWR